MRSLGDPTSYLQVQPGVPVLSSDGERVGALVHVLADESMDIFDGVIIDADAGSGGYRFADAEQIDQLRDAGVILAIDGAEARELPEPTENPTTLSTDPDDVTPDTARDKLRRAWDYLSGNY